MRKLALLLLFAGALLLTGCGEDEYEYTSETKDSPDIIIEDINQTTTSDEEEYVDAVPDPEDFEEGIPDEESPEETGEDTEDYEEILVGDETTEPPTE